MSSNNQCPQCHDYPEYRGACGVCEGTGTQPQSKEQTKATVGDSTQNAVHPWAIGKGHEYKGNVHASNCWCQTQPNNPQESTKDPMPCPTCGGKPFYLGDPEVNSTFPCPDCSPKEAKPGDQQMQMNELAEELRKSTRKLDELHEKLWPSEATAVSPVPKTITLMYLVVPRANNGEDAFKWIAFHGREQTADVPFKYADTPQDALRQLLADV